MVSIGRVSIRIKLIGATADNAAAEEIFAITRPITIIMTSLTKYRAFIPHNEMPPIPQDYSREKERRRSARCCCRHLHRGLLRGAREQASRSPRGPHTSIFPLAPLEKRVRTRADRWRQLQRQEQMPLDRPTVKQSDV